MDSFDINSEKYKGINILIIEDEEKYVNGILKILNKTSCNTYVFDFDIEENVKHYIDNHKIEIAIVDIGLPNGYDGRTMIQQIKDYDKNIKVLTLTNQTSGQDMEKNIEVGADLHMRKPVSEKMLIKNLDVLLA